MGLLAVLVRSYAFQRTSLMIESNRVSHAQVDAAIVRLATSSSMNFETLFSDPPKAKRSVRKSMTPFGTSRVNFTVSAVMEIQASQRTQGLEPDPPGAQVPLSQVQA